LYYSIVWLDSGFRRNDTASLLVPMPIKWLASIGVAGVIGQPAKWAKVKEKPLALSIYIIDRIH
jgi:hypothetical protein